MSARRPLRWSVVVVILVAIGCDTDSVTDSTRPCVPADVAGVWDVRWVDDGRGTIACFDPSHVCKITQSGCDVTIGSEDWDPANGATGSARAGRLYVEWTWYEGCHGIRETIDATVAGDTLTGTFYRAAWRVVLPDCPAGGLCSAALSGVRRTPVQHVPGTLG